MTKLIFGITDLADVLYYELRTAGIEPDAFCVEAQYMKESKHMGKPVVAFEDIGAAFGDEIGVWLCIGYTSMNRVRARVYNSLKQNGVQLLSFVHQSAVVMADEMGEGCLIFEGAVLGPYTRIGNCNIFYPKSMLSHHSVAGDFNFFAISCSVAGNVSVGNNCFIGNNAATKDGIAIGDFSLIGAGSYVSRDVEAGSCIVPARSVRLDNHTGTDFI